MESKIEHSAGGVVFNCEHQKVEIILTSREDNNIWCLPKGKLELGETKEQAALREVKEETGADSEILSFLKTITYTYKYNLSNVVIDKSVDFFLMKFKTGKLSNSDAKVDSVEWFDLEKAFLMLSYDKECEVLGFAKKAIEDLLRTK